MPTVDRKSEIQKIAEASVGISLNTSTDTYVASYPEGMSLPSGTRYYEEPIGNGQSVSFPSWPRIETNPDAIDDGLIERIWEKMYHKKVILTCKWCGAANAFDNPTCVQCGGPPG